jgi:ribosomal-protein-alanine N-acetyltransferase
VTRAARRPPLRLRPATTDDVDTVAALEEQVFGADAWSRTGVRDEIVGPHRQFMVAVDDNAKLCGYVAVLGVAEVADLQRIVVAPAYRRRGVGSALLDACDLSAHERVVLEVRADNHPALAFYRRHGFAEISRRRAYYADGTDAIVMQRPASR